MLLKVASGEKGQSGGLSRGFDRKPLDGSQQTRSRLSAEHWSEVEKIFLTGSAAACHFGLVMTLSDFVGEHGALSINSQCCLHCLRLSSILPKAVVPFQVRVGLPVIITHKSKTRPIYLKKKHIKI